MCVCVYVWLKISQIPLLQLSTLAEYWTIIKLFTKNAIQLKICINSKNDSKKINIKMKRKEAVVTCCIIRYLKKKEKLSKLKH